jgi:hypothetical protein
MIDGGPMLQKIVLFTVLTVAGIAVMNYSAGDKESPVYALLDKSARVFRDISDLF